MTEKKMEKPQKTTVSELFFDYHQMIDWIEQEYNIDTRDYARNHDHFPHYLKVTNQEKPNYPNALDLQKGKITKEFYDAEVAKIHKQYREYQEWCKSNPEPEYLDFWHWIIEEQWPEVHNGCYKFLDLTEKTIKKAPKWVGEILTLIKKEFGENKDDLKVWIEW